MADCATWDASKWKSPEKALEGIKFLIKEAPDFPKKGILFRDIMPVFQVPKAVTAITDLMVEYIKNNYSSVDAIAGLDARGFLIGTMIAVALEKPFFPVRKQGKLPGECHSVESKKEYGADVLEIQKHAIKAGQKVVIIDDLLATGGTMKASCELMEKAGLDVIGSLCIIELLDLNGQAKLKYPFHALIQY